MLLSGREVYGRLACVWQVERKTHTHAEREGREGGREGGEHNKHLVVACFPERE